MAFTVVITEKTVIGNRRMNFGTFTSDATTPATFATGLRLIEYVELNPLGSTNTCFADNVGTSMSAVSSGSGTTGCWMAIGY